MKLGDRVQKASGDYTFYGKIVADFRKVSGERRFVVEDERGLLLIMNERQLEVVLKRRTDAIVHIINGSEEARV